MILAVILSVTTMAIVAFAVGFICGQASGRRQARIAAFYQCIDWAALAMKGSSSWRYLSVDAALLKAGALIGSADVMVPAVHPARVHSPAPFHYESAALSKGKQA